MYIYIYTYIYIYWRWQRCDSRRWYDTAVLYEPPGQGPLHRSGSHAQGLALWQGFLRDMFRCALRIPAVESMTFV